MRTPDLSPFGESVSARLEGQVHELKMLTAEAKMKVKDSLDTAVQATNRCVHNYTWTAVLIMVAAGAVAGYSLRKSMPSS